MTDIIDPKAFFASRENERKAFVRAHVPDDFTIETVGADWASRRYLRVRAGDKAYVLLESVPDHLPTATMGHKLSAFIRINKLLHEKAIHVPEIYAADEKEGYVLLEDMGDTTVNAALNAGGDQYDLYGAATNVLVDLRDRIDPGDLCDFPKYKDSYIRKGRRRIVDWYIPATRNEINSDDLLAGYLKAWDDVALALPPPPIGFMHGDFHPGNLMLLKDGTCGVLDFQDAMAGPTPYDLANLLENIRRDVPHDIYDAMMQRYGGDEAFMSWFRVMATQFHCRIIGQVIRLAVVSGKNELLQYMPRIQNYIREGLKNPVLKPLADWMNAEKVDLQAMSFDPEKIRPYIRSDAF